MHDMKIFVMAHLHLRVSWTVAIAVAGRLQFFYIEWILYSFLRLQSPFHLSKKFIDLQIILNLIRPLDPWRESGKADLTDESFRPGNLTAGIYRIFEE